MTIAIYLKIVNRRDALKSLGLAMASLTLPGMAEGKSGSQPWGSHPFSVRRYRISEAKNLELVDEKQSTGDHLNLQSRLAPEAIELIVLQR